MPGCYFPPCPRFPWADTLLISLHFQHSAPAFQQSPPCPAPADSKPPPPGFPTESFRQEVCSGGRLRGRQNEAVTLLSIYLLIHRL